MPSSLYPLFLLFHTLLAVSLEQRSTTPLACVAQRNGYVAVISLPSRLDRVMKIKEEVHALGVVKWELIPAVAHSCGALGCALSHVLATQRCIQSRQELCLILEDDFEVNRDFSSNFSINETICTALNISTPWNVLLPSSHVLSAENASSHSYKLAVAEAMRRVN
jgi:hypothetical protein